MNIDGLNHILFPLNVIEFSNVLRFIERGVTKNDERLVGRALRLYFSSLRRRVTKKIILNSLEQNFELKDQEYVKNDLSKLLGLIPDYEQDHNVEKDRNTVSDLEEKNRRAIEELKKKGKKEPESEPKKDDKDDNMKVEESQSKSAKKKASTPKKAPFELEIFYRLVALVLLIDYKKVKEVSEHYFDYLES